MKNKTIKILCPTILLLLGACSNSTPTSCLFTVTFSESEAYVISGEKTAKKGETYTFQVKPNKFYDLSNIVVKSNDAECIKVDEYTYQSLDVREDLFISVTGAKAEAYISIKTKSYYFEIDNVPSIAKNDTYYREDVVSKYLGYNTSYSVDLSSVDFDNVGSYSITYQQVEHPEVVSFASVIIYSLDIIDNASIDVGNIHSPFLDGKYGEPFIDFNVYDYNGAKLSEYDMVFDGFNNYTYLSASYVRRLSPNQNYNFTFKAPYETTGRSFVLSVKDELAPQYSFENESTSLSYFENKVNLPNVKKSEDSVQNITVKYYLDNEEKKDPATCNKLVTNLNKTYSYDIKFEKNGVTLDEFSKHYDVSLKPAGNKYFSFENNCDLSNPGKGGFADISLSDEGNYVLDINDAGSGDTYLYFKDEFLKKYNTSDKDYIFIVFKILNISASGLSPSIWFMDAENIKDYPNPKDAVGKVNYTGYQIPEKGSYISMKIKINKTDGHNRYTMANNVIFRDLVGRFEIKNFSFRNYGEVVPYYDALYSDVGSFGDYITFTKIKDANFVKNENYFVKGSGDRLFFKANKLFTEMQKDNKKYLAFDIEITSNVKDKNAKSVFACHGGGAIDEYPSISLVNGKGKVIIDLKSYLYDIDYRDPNTGEPFLLSLSLYGCTAENYEQVTTSSGVIMNQQQFLSSKYFISDSDYKISNLQFLSSL